MTGRSTAPFSVNAMLTTVYLPNLRREPDASDEAFLFACQKKLGIRAEDVHRFRIVRQSLDARKKQDIFFLTHVELTVDEATARRILKNPKLQAERVQKRTLPEPIFGTRQAAGRIVVVGLGPGGLFAAWQLAKYGYRPLIIERGKPISERVLDVETYWTTGRLHTASNVAFGEGGAGTFSDGKLTTRIKDDRIDGVLKQLIACGAPEEIAYLAKPHIGTDRLRTVVQTMREEICRLGGEVRFETTLTDLVMRDGELTAVEIEHCGRTERVECSALVLAIGQAARDTYRMLFDRGVAMAPKAFAVGVRAEHPQIMVNQSQYGSFWDHPRLGAAEYRLTAKSGTRGVYTFCMCPGGKVVASASGEGQIVVNGMSDYARDGENANAAVVVQVTPEDFGTHPLDGLRFQEELERKAYLLGGGDGVAPACTVGDYLQDRPTQRFGSVHPSYRPGVRGVLLKECLPDFVAAGVRDGLRDFGRKLKGYDRDDAVLTAVESRTSAPLRILRNEEMQSLSVRALYPVGEGCGYAGGIVSAAVDGWKAAEAVMRQYRPNTETCQGLDQNATRM